MEARAKRTSEGVGLGGTGSVLLPTKNAGEKVTSKKKEKRTKKVGKTATIPWVTKTEKRSGTKNVIPTSRGGEKNAERKRGSMRRPAFWETIFQGNMALDLGGGRTVW